jgi:hypothetical protein
MWCDDVVLDGGDLSRISLCCVRKKAAAVPSAPVARALVRLVVQRLFCTGTSTGTGQELQAPVRWGYIRSTKQHGLDIEENGVQVRFLTSWTHDTNCHTILICPGAQAIGIGVAQLFVDDFVYLPFTTNRWKQLSLCTIAFCKKWSTNYQRQRRIGHKHIIKLLLIGQVTRHLMR